MQDVNDIQQRLSLQWSAPEDVPTFLVLDQVTHHPVNKYFTTLSGPFCKNVTKYLAKLFMEGNIDLIYCAQPLAILLAVA